MEQSNADFLEKVEAIFDKLEAYEPPFDPELEVENKIGCSKCQNGYIFTQEGMRHCSCYIEHQLRVRFKKAGIPAEYYPYRTLEIIGLKALKGRYGQDTSKGQRVEAAQVVENFHRNAERVLETGWNLVLEGPTGTGKTTAASIILMHLIRQQYDVQFVQAEQLRKAFLHEDEEFKKRLEQVQFLVIDDIGAEFMSERSDFYITQLDNLLRTRTANKRVTIYTTNQKQKTIEERYGARIASLMKKDTVHLLMFVDYDIRCSSEMPDFL